jgi:hypothetical protein
MTFSLMTKFLLLNDARNMTLRIRADFVNAFNFVNFQGPDANGSASAFGTISSAYPPWNIQLGLKLQFYASLTGASSGNWLAW